MADNCSGNFNPVNIRTDLSGQIIAAPAGTTREYGVLIEPLDRRVSLRVNDFHTIQTSPQQQCPRRDGRSLQLRELHAAVCYPEGRDQDFHSPRSFRSKSPLAARGAVGAAADSPALSRRKDGQTCKGSSMKKDSAAEGRPTDAVQRGWLRAESSAGEKDPMVVSSVVASVN